MRNVLTSAGIAIWVLSWCLSACERREQLENGESQAEKSERADPALAPENFAASATKYPRLKKENVMALQKALAEASYYKRDIHGVFSRATKRALQRYQHDHNLPVTGEPDDETLKRLGVSFKKK